MKTYLAIDVGVEQCRLFLGNMTETGVKLNLISQFPNNVVDAFGHKYWDLFSLYGNIVDALRQVSAMDVTIESIGVCALSQDFCCFGADGQLISHPFSSKEQGVSTSPQKFYARIARTTLYRMVGMQEMPNKAIFQFDAMQRMGSATLAMADKILFMPDALIYMLTGEMVCEASIASASGMVNLGSRGLDQQLMLSVGLSPQHFGTFVQPGMMVGLLSEQLQQLTHLRDVPVVAVCSDQALSASLAAPAVSRNWAWLNADYRHTIGITTDRPALTDRAEQLNLDNVCAPFDTYCVMKQTSGKRLLSLCQRELDTMLTTQDMVKLVLQAPDFQSIFDTDDPSFVNTTSFARSLKSYCERTSQQAPASEAETIKCLLLSVANKQAELLCNLEEVQGTKVQKLFVMGPGSVNDVLCQYIATASQTEVTAGPIFASAAGNVIIQAMMAGEVRDIDDVRIRQSKDPDLRTFVPDVHI